MASIRNHRRDGFTLIELLVVIAVIALLTSLLVGASFRFVVSARESATIATINKVNGILEDRVRAFRDFDFSDEAVSTSYSYNIKNSADQIMTPNLAEVIVRKVRYKKAFPQAFAELDTSQLARFFPSYSTIPPGYPTPGATGNASTFSPKFESGIVLYAMLINGETFGAVTPNTDAFSGAEVINTPLTGNLPCLVDAWGEPLRFYRYPTRLIRCGEMNFDGSGINTGALGATNYDDYNQNQIQEKPGWDEKNFKFCPPIRPNGITTAATPASLMIANLPPYTPPVFGAVTPPAAIYAWGPDQYPGANPNTNGAPFNGPPFTYSGAPESDDPETLNIDPDDPTFQLTTWLFLDGNQTGAQLATRRAGFISTFHDFYTWHTPLIVSAGADRQLGLWEPTDVPTPANPTSVNFGYLAAPNWTTISASGVPDMHYLFDNITNLNQRAGGK